MSARHKRASKKHAHARDSRGTLTACISAPSPPTADHPRMIVKKMLTLYLLLNFQNLARQETRALKLFYNFRVLLPREKIEYFGNDSFNFNFFLNLLIVNRLRQLVEFYPCQNIRDNGSIYTACHLFAIAYRILIA